MKNKYLILSFISLVLGACNLQPEQVEENVSVVSLDSKIERGNYLVTTLGCNDCHSPKVMTQFGPMPDSLRLLSGHPAEEILPSYNKDVLKSYVLFNMGSTAAIGPWGTSYAANLTPDETGIGNWTETQFITAMKKGKWKGLENSRNLLPPMPWQAYSQMPEKDLSAIFAYLKSLKPVKNTVPLAQAPLN